VQAHSLFGSISYSVTPAGLVALFYISLTHSDSDHRPRSAISMGRTHDRPVTPLWQFYGRTTLQHPRCAAAPVRAACFVVLHSERGRSEAKLRGRGCLTHCLLPDLFVWCWFLLHTANAPTRLAYYGYWNDYT
jgi:hypothetical protein